MKNVLIITFLSALLLTACRTNEANYKAAYEHAVSRKQDTTSGIDNTVYDKIRREASGSTTVWNGDTISIKRQHVALVNNEGPKSLQEAYIIVAQFKQIFNAKSMCQRLVDNGNTEACILSTREPLYYVAINSGSKAEMIQLCSELIRKQTVTTKPPYPLVLQPASR